MKIRDLLADRGATGLWTIAADRQLFEAAGVIATSDAGALVVTGEGGKVVGIVSERDLIRVLATRCMSAGELLVGDVMTRAVTTCSGRRRK